MSEVANIGENQQPNAVQEAKAASSGDMAAAKSMPAPALTPTESAAATPEEKQVTTNNAVDEGAAGDAGNSSVEVAKLAETSPKVENKKTPAKRTPSKRLSFIERAQKESEELVKTMGGSLELEGGRRTRSSTRGTPTRAAAVSTPPPAKKARTSPANAGGTPSKGRARGRKIDTSVADAEEEAKKAAAAEQSTEKEADDAAEKPTAEAPEIPHKEKNAPEEAEAKETADSAPPTEVAAETPPTSADTPDTEEPRKSIADAEPAASEDNPDATLQIVPEEKQNNVDHVAAADKPEEPAVTADSPMETDEQPEQTVTPVASTAADSATTASAPVAENAPTAAIEIAVKPATEEDKPSVVTTKAPANAQVAKEPTPEPMEVDSNSKSNDDAEQVEKAVTQNDAAAPADSTESQQANAIEIVADDVKNNATKVNSNNTEIVDAGEKVTAPVAAVSSLEESKKCEVASADVTNTTTTTSENKTQPDFCEPKIASPSINVNNDAAVTTPQFCN